MSLKILPLTKLPVGSVPPAVLVCGDPARAEKTADLLDGAALLSKNREYHTYAGTYNGREVAVCSHGIGAAGAALAFEELIAAGAKRMIRIGSCGGVNAAVTDGDLVVATAAVAHTGYVREVAPAHYPAVADPVLVMALRRAAEAHTHERPLHSGIVLTRDGFYPGVGTAQTPDYSQLARANVLAVEMECAALFVVGSLRQIPTAAILAVDGNVLSAPETMDSYEPHREIVDQAITAEIEIALEAVTEQ